MIFALAGNQNCGKTTLFNQLTGSNQHVGNFPGVTVARKEGAIRGSEQHTVVDLPGIYSLSPYTSEEIITRDFILDSHPDGIVNIIDGTNIERNLYLTLQLLELGIPTVLAVNMMDEVRVNGMRIDLKILSQELGIPVIPICAIKGEGIHTLIHQLLETTSDRRKPGRQEFYTGPVSRTVHAVNRIAKGHAQAVGIPPHFATVKLIEGDPPMLQKLRLSQNEISAIESFVHQMERECDMDREAALADIRYKFIEKVCKKAVTRCGETKGYLRSVRIDSVLTHKYLGIPIFLSIMLLIFWLTFGIVGAVLSDGFLYVIQSVTNLMDWVLTACGIHPIVHSLVIDGICNGVGAVLSFLPTIVVLFFFLSILEDSGYMARVAFVMDKLLRKIGLSGRSFVPMLIGFGCSVPAIMATRTLSSDRDRRMTIMLIPFMSCSAKLPVYSIISMAFFPSYAALVMIILYIGGIATGILTAWILKNTTSDVEAVPFVMELPNYRMPSLRNVVMLLSDKAHDFLQRAFTIIFMATVIIWFLQTFDLHLQISTDTSQSILALLGSCIAPIFAPLGFGDWRAATALIAGFTAKEAVVSTLTILTGGNLTVMLNPASAAAFLAFILLYTPCIAAVTVVKNELSSVRSAAAIAVFQCILAWYAAFIVYHIAVLFI